MHVNKKYIGLLFLLYISQGLSFGFQATALPLIMRSHGISLKSIGFAGMLSMPWVLKAFWAPLVDRYYNLAFGRRKSWILPMQSLLIVTMFTASFFNVSNLPFLLSIIFLLNLFAATQDIAVDGLAVDLLYPNELGLGNTAQVVGYKIGILIGGGLLVWASQYIGWSGLFVSMATIALIALIAIIMFNENQAINYRKREKINKTKTDFRLLVKTLSKTLRQPNALWIIGLIMLYKTGESMVDAMFKPFLLDSSFTASQIGLWLGTYGIVASLLGSFISGWMSTRIQIWKVLGLSLVLRLVPLIAQYILTLGQPSVQGVIITTLAEHFFGGMLTTVMFAFMMLSVNKTVSATHYTILASLEVIGRSPAVWASGFIAQIYGYGFLFAVGIFLSLLVLPFWWRAKMEVQY